MILGDRELRYYIEKKLIVIEPFDPQIIRENGLDLRLGDEIARLKPTSEPFDPRNPPKDLSRYYVIERGDSFVINPHEHVLLTTLEYIKLPSDLMAFVNLRSSFARLGIYAPPCVHPDTIIHTDNGLVLEASQASTVISYQPETGEPLPGAVTVKALTRNTSRQLIRVTTSLGWIDVTPNHKFMVFDPLGLDQAWVEKTAYSIELGDLIAVPGRISYSTNNSENVLEPLPETCVKPRGKLLDKILEIISERGWSRDLYEILDDDLQVTISRLLSGECAGFSTFKHLLQALGLNYSYKDLLNQLDYYDNSLKKYRPLQVLAKEINDKLSYFVGVVTGSSISRVDEKGEVKIIAEFKDQEDLLEFMNVINNIIVTPDDLDITMIESKKKIHVRLTGDTRNLLIHNFPESFLENPGKRSVPLNIQTSTTNIVGAFLKGLFDVRGVENPVGYNVEGLKLAKQLQLLLLRYGIHARLSSRSNGYVVEICTSDDIEVFMKEVLGSKTRALKASTTRAEKVKVVPLTLYAAKVLERLSIMNKSLVREISDFVKNRELPSSIIPMILEELIEYKPAGYMTAYKHILFLSNYYWDKVINKTSYEYNGYIVDWQTKTHWYLAGIYITHNTIVDAGFEGTLTIELVGGEFPVKLYRGDRFLHLVFAKLTGPVEKPYRGRYLRQRGVTIPWFTKDSL